jgi:hypothetical protein
MLPAVQTKIGMTVTTAHTRKGNMKDGERKSSMDDLEKRAKQLDAEPDTNIYMKALQKEKWRELALKAIERLEAAQQPIDCEGPALGERGKVDIRQFTCRKFYDETPADLDSLGHHARPACNDT